MAIKTIAVDFDSTLVTTVPYPYLGVVRENAKEVLDRFVEAGHEVIIWSCRDKEVIVDFLNQHEIPYHAINENTEHLKMTWGNNPRKIGADLFIDDKNIFAKEIDWYEIEKELIRLKWL